ncbi:MAG: multiple antibiotic resistance protein [Clostridiales bacterium]|jgi:multiple antibiotic resistance protein|nr:multiple antibiotic resistance protein [Clostridiales bacterium]
MLTDLLHYGLLVFTGFFAIMNPVANAPIFMGLVSGNTQSEKKEIARNACITAFVIVTAFVLLGKYIFELFDLTVPAFRIAGGIIIFYVGFEMLQSKASSIHNVGSEKADGSIAFSPLATPILAGPGTIVTAMNFVAQVSLIHIFIVIFIFALMLYITYEMFVWSDRLVKWTGEGAIIAIGKIMGLILTVIGTGMVIEGIKWIMNSAS